MRNIISEENRRDESTTSLLTSVILPSIEHPFSLIVSSSRRPSPVFFIMRPTGEWLGRYKILKTTSLTGNKINIGIVL